MPTLRFDPKTVKGIGPQHVEVVAGVRLTDVCEKHQKVKDQHQHWLLFSSPGYNEFADTLCVFTYDPTTQQRPLGTVARIMGVARTNWRKAIENAAPGDTVPFLDSCGCIAVKISSEELLALVVDKEFPCEYAIHGG